MPKMYQMHFEMELYPGHSW